MLTDSGQYAAVGEQNGNRDMGPTAVGSPSTTMVSLHELVLSVISNQDGAGLERGCKS